MDVQVHKLFLWIVFITDLTVNSFNHNCCEFNEESSTFSCDQCGLTEIPDDIPPSTRTLILRNNQLSKIPSSGFVNWPNMTHLDLFDNPINELEDGSFEGLSNLEHLDLRRTEYHLQKPLPSEIFSPLLNLTTLKLDYIFPANTREMPASLFDLEHLNFLQMAVPEGFVFGGNFKKLKNLQTLVIFGWDCNLGIITDETFASLAELDIKVLEVRDCKVAHVDPMGFTHFHKLSTLNLACNKEGTLSNFFKAVREVPSKDLTTLILDGSSKKDLFNAFDINLVNGRVFQQLTHLSLRSAKILQIHPEVFLELPNLRHFTFGFNFLFFSPDKDIFNRTANIIKASKLQYVDVSHYGEFIGGHNNFRHIYCRGAELCSDDFFRKVPPYIQLPKEIDTSSPQEVNYTRYEDREQFLLDNIPSSLNVIFARSLASRSTKLNGLNIPGDNNLIYMDLSLLPIKSVVKPLFGLNKLQGLDLSSCRIDSVVPDALAYLPSLVYLNLTRNNLRNTDLNELLTNVSTLKWLDISFTDIETIPNDTFSKMENLTALSLKGNHVSQINLNLTGNNLEFLDLSLCALPYLDKNFIDSLEEIQRRRNKTLTLDLSGNIFECECSAVYFMEWLDVTNIVVPRKQDLMCRYNDKNSTIMSVNRTELKRRCSGWPSNEVLLTIAVGIVTLAVVAVYGAFEYRWTLRWYKYKIVKYFTTKWRILFYGNANQEMEEEYKVFISYDQEDHQISEWVEHELVTRIESLKSEIFDEDPTQTGMEMTTCLIRRDFDPGWEYLGIASVAVEKSQFTIIVINSTYDKSGYCITEMRMALEKGINRIIVIVKEQVEEMDDMLRGLLTVSKSLEYSEDEKRQKQFYAELQSMLESNP